jgi:peptidoglycan/LPS O-acetylase OafA/YrhL
MNYRKEIDGLRAIAVLSVIFFHFGIYGNGFLGVDIFFTISGFLITSIVYNETLNNTFSITKFYLRRIRRIIPLVLFIVLFSLIVGYFVMLPDDFENLCESIIATNLFSNNILLLITTGNYWDVVNEYKPLMHTWSLGVEEQFYLLFPLLFSIFKSNKKLIITILTILTVFSLIIFINSNNSESKFYLLQYRFFELSFGGIGALTFFNNRIKHRYSIIILIIILGLLTFRLKLTNDFLIFSITLLTTLLLCSDLDEDKITHKLLSNNYIVWIGKISFSLYMVHQFVLSFFKYFLFDNLNVLQIIFLLIIIFVISIFTYLFVENKFRNPKIISTRILLISLPFVLFTTTVVSFYFYKNSGITRDVPELDLYKNTTTNHLHASYNDRIYSYKNDFVDNSKIHVLIVGNSFARDFANILLESRYKNKLEISYLSSLNTEKSTINKINKANIIFFSEYNLSDYHNLQNKYKIDSNKVWNVGTKNFGNNNGIIYNKLNLEPKYNQTAYINKDYINKNISQKNEWKNKYVDLLSPILINDKVRVFTYNNKFISQDCRHLTISGAKFYAQILDNRLNQIIK